MSATAVAAIVVVAAATTTAVAAATAIAAATVIAGSTAVVAATDVVNDGRYCGVRRLAVICKSLLNVNEQLPSP